MGRGKDAGQGQVAQDQPCQKMDSGDAFFVGLCHGIFSTDVYMGDHPEYQLMVFPPIHNVHLIQYKCQVKREP